MMKIEEYQGLAMRTSPDDHDRVLNGCMGLIGEAGEVVDATKKWLFQSGDNATFPIDKIIDECGDILWYCAELATGLNADLAEIYTHTKARFDDMRSFHESKPLAYVVMMLAAIAQRPAVLLYDTPYDNSKNNVISRCATVKAEIVGIMSTVRDILEICCGVSLIDCMEHNIEKLRRRYPDGFDPERSLHRKE